MLEKCIGRQNTTYNNQLLEAQMGLYIKINTFFYRLCSLIIVSNIHIISIIKYPTAKAAPKPFELLLKIHWTLLTSASSSLPSATTKSTTLASARPPLPPPTYPQHWHSAHSALHTNPPESTFPPRPKYTLHILHQHHRLQPRFKRKCIICTPYPVSMC